MAPQRHKSKLYAHPKEHEFSLNRKSIMTVSSPDHAVIDLHDPDVNCAIVETIHGLVQPTRNTIYWELDNADGDGGDTLIIR